MNSLLINEHKGILLSIILWITDYQKKLSNKLIQTNLSKYLIPLSKLFPELIWYTTISNSKLKKFDIQINSQILGDLNIGFIDTYKKLNANKVYLAPWSDPDNPIIIFVLDKKKQNLKKIKNQIIEYNIRSNLKQWSTQIEKYILDRYFKSSNVFVSMNHLVKYIDSLFNQIVIKKKSKLKKLVIPNYMSNFIPIVFSTDYRKQIEQIKEMIEKKENKYKNLLQDISLEASKCTNKPDTDYLNLKREIDDLRKIIEILNQSFQTLEENNNSALGYQVTNFNPTELLGGRKINN
jgi:hypothetical protein